MTRYTVTFVAVAFAAGGSGGFLLGSRTHRDAPTTSAKTHSSTEAEPSTAIPALSAPRVAEDCQSVKNQLAICTAYHPAPSETEKFLAMCRADLEMCRNKPSLPACWDFVDLAPIYDRELGEADPSPETIERAKKLSAEECAEVITWEERAGLQQRRCLNGRDEPPPGFEEKYGRPVAERPFPKACRRTDALNAFFRREAQRGGGHPLHIGGKRDGWGLVYALPDGSIVRPVVPEDDLDASAP